MDWFGIGPGDRVNIAFMRNIFGAIAAASFVLAVALPAQKPLVLTIETIMRGPGLVGYEPAEPRWSGDSRRIYFQWKRPSDPVLQPMDTYAVSRDGSGLRKLSDEEARLAPPASGDRSKDKRLTVFAREGDIYIYDQASGNGRQVTKTAEVESNPHFTRDGKRIWFTRAGNLYRLTLDGGMIEQLTDIRIAGAVPPTATPSVAVRSMDQTAQSSSSEEQKGTESQEFIKKEERSLLDVVAQKARAREQQEARKKLENPRKPLTLQARESVLALSLSPDEKIVIASITQGGDRAKTTLVPNYVTESAYTEDIAGRGKVGDAQSRSRVALIAVETGEVHWIDHDQKTAPAKPGEKPVEREVQLQQPVWSEDGSRAILNARSADNKDRWILALDASSGKTRVVFHDHDDAWISRTGASDLGWINDHEIYLISERSGYAHLYSVAYESGAPRQLTSGNWEVHSVKLSEDKSTFYLTTNEGDPGQVHLYTMPSSGGPRTKITTLIGHHQPVLSPNELWFADVYSYTNKPPELYAMENRGGAEEVKLTSSPAPEFWTYPWQDVPIVRFKASDGAEMRARIYKPTSFKGGGPAVIFVHGAGYLQNVHRWWSQYYREYMFHNFLTEHGYIVLDVDYRGSAGYGRDWRTAIYRHMGGRDLDDEVDAARWLVSEFGVNPQKIGLYGGSYGGFITLMAMFTQPDVFAAGAALRPVTDWAHYNHGYTSDILNAPQSDAEAYRRSSPIYFAAGLKGALLICHGMVDTNVHFQDTVRLVQKLIELHKDRWELAVFPAEDHGFLQPSSWTDEYKRIYQLFEKNLK
jgi:dipeptidyl aminopeptidase/acylaminoacyl peptidase